jgi:peptidoglycan/LPS O-acetylase OafA/YrhL
LTGFLGLAVLVVMMQSSGGFSIELLGPDLLIVGVGFAVTRSILATEGRNLRAWYERQIRLYAPLLAGVLALVLAAIAVIGPYAPSALTTADALGTIGSSFTWWGLAPRPPSFDQIDPLGAVWLIGLLAQYCLVWPAVLAGLCRALAHRRQPWLRRAIGPGLAVGAAVAAAVGPLLAASGAGAAELTLGAHVRLSEWLLGAAAAALALGLSRTGKRLSSTFPVALLGAGAAVLVAMAAVATLWPDHWLRAAGPSGAALGAALILIALEVAPEAWFAQTLSSGLPMEIGRMAYPLLLLHLPVFWAVQLVIPAARPFALLVVGGALSWLLGLLLQDGIVRRWQARPRQLGFGVLIVVALLGVVTASADGLRSAAIGVGRPKPVVLVVGGSFAGGIASAMNGPASPFTVVDASRPGCGLLPAAAAVTTARTTAQAQAPAGVAECGDGAQQWRARIAAVDPDVIVADFSNDAAHGVPGPCDPAFRTTYRTLFGSALNAWTDGDPERPILLATVPHTDQAVDLARRCENAMVVELIGAHRAVWSLDLDGLLCPEDACRTTTKAGQPLYDSYGGLTPDGVDDIGPWILDAVSARLRVPHDATTTPACTARDNGDAAGGC